MYFFLPYILPNLVMASSHPPASSPIIWRHMTVMRHEDSRVHLFKQGSVTHSGKSVIHPLLHTSRGWRLDSIDVIDRGRESMPLPCAKQSQHCSFELISHGIIKIQTHAFHITAFLLHRNEFNIRAFFNSSYVSSYCLLFISQWSNATCDLRCYSKQAIHNAHCQS